MKTYSILINGKVNHTDLYLSEFQAKRKYEQLKKKLEYYKDHGSETGRIKATKDLATLQIVEDREPKTFVQARNKLDYVLRSRQHLIDDLVKLKAQMEAHNKASNETYRELVQAFNKSSRDGHLFITQAGEFILTNAQKRYLQMNGKPELNGIQDIDKLVDRFVMNLLEGGWFGGDLYELGKVIDLMVDGKYVPQGFEHGFVDYDSSKE